MEYVLKIVGKYEENVVVEAKTEKAALNQIKKHGYEAKGIVQLSGMNAEGIEDVENLGRRSV